jgi:hypothetical protein
MKLTEGHIKIIQEFVDQQISIITLKDDVLDHLCCSVEHMMSQGKSFEDSLQNSIRELAPQGLVALEHETIYLLQRKNIPMKKMMYSIGLVTTISMTMGLMFKILHMPGADQLLDYGFLTFALIFLPMVAVTKFRQNGYQSLFQKLKSLLGWLSAAGVGLAVLLKMAVKLESSELVLMVSVSIFCFGFLPFLFYDLYKGSFKKEKQDNLDQLA